MEAFDDLVTEVRPSEQDWQDFGDQVRAEEDRKARVLSSIQLAMRERLDSSVGLSDIIDEKTDSDVPESEDIREQLFEGIPDPYPHSTKFQRVIISESGEDIDNDTIKSCESLNKCMNLRGKWISDCSPPNPRSECAVLQSGEKGLRRRPGSVYNIFGRSVPGTCNDYSYMMVRGVFEVRKIRPGDSDEGVDCIAGSFEDFIEDYVTVVFFLIFL